MSIADKIARLKAAKDAMIATLAAKGVDVSTDAGFEDFPALTKRIATGDTEIEDGLVARTITEYYNDRVATIGGYVFMNYTALKSVSFPNVTELAGSSNFRECTNLESIDLPKLTKTGSHAFFGCKALKQTKLPSYSSSSATPVFKGCSALELVDFAGALSVSTNAFANCESLKIVIFRGDSVTSLSSVDTFSNSPFAADSTGGTLYVKSALIEQYKTATNWSVLYEAGTCNFVAIEGSEYE